MRLGFSTGFSTAFSTLALVCATVDLAIAASWGGHVGAEVGDVMAAPCRSSLTASAPLPANVPPGGLRLQVCRNDECQVYDLAGAPLFFTASTACDGACYLGDGVVQVSLPVAMSQVPATTDTYDVRLFDPLGQRTYAASHGRLIYAPSAAVASVDPRTRECPTAEVSARSLEGS